MPAPFLSRHFLAEQASCVAQVPFAAAGAAEDGVAITHNLLAMGTWCEDAQEARLTLIDLAVGHSGDEIVQQPAMTRLASFHHSGGRVAALEVADCGNGAVLVLAASGDGSVSRLRMQVPTQPGSQPTAIQLREEDFDGALLLPWLVDVHPQGVAALCANTDRKELLTAGADGSLFLTPLGADSSSSGTRLYSSAGAVTFTAAHWCGSQTAVTGSLQGLLHTWDTRQAGGPVLQLEQPSAMRDGTVGLPRLAPAITCLDVHPAQHFCCATGGSDGGVALWDLRLASSSSSLPQAAASSFPGSKQPLQTAVSCCAVGSTGDGRASAVCDIQFEGAGSIGSGSQRLIYCTSGGAVGVIRDVAAATGRLLFQEPTAAVRACCLGAAGPCSQVFACTDQEGLLYMANAL
ncbi:hypothetical protein D9Q98_007236 [Chlorella vulgaris]|uniref:Uncharacterized protein n=1 Tax=Chlorella vulgaris TaxID=3077 RepID=A0A9D4TKU9_CHLVU|nr:hypothetical protein D9Q98_007236 [Chlorella vulgaris]